MKAISKLAIVLVVVAGVLNINAHVGKPKVDNKALLRKWTYRMIEVPSVREMLNHASYEESEMIKDQYARAYKGTYLKFNADNTFEIQKTPNGTPSKGTWRYDANNSKKLYMKENQDKKEQETFIAKLNRQQLVLTNGKENDYELVQIYLVPFE